MKIAITGAKGQLGQIVIEKLKERTAKENLVALVRSVQNSTLDIEARSFDYDQEQGLGESLQGVDVLLLISGSEIGRREIQHKNVINAAKQAGVKRVVYTSILHADTSKMALAAEHIATEKALKESGLDYTILRNSWYTENYAGTIAGSIQAGAFIGSAGQGRISSATREDFAQAAAVVLTNEGHENKTYELAGDSSYTLTEFAAEVSKQVGKELAYHDLPEAEYTKALVSIGLPEGFASVLADSDFNASKGSLFSEDKTLSKLIGRPTTPFADVVKKFLA